MYPKLAVLNLANTKESTNYLLDFQKKIRMIFKAITAPLKDLHVLIILRILTVVLPSFGLGNRSILETCTTGTYCWVRSFTVKSKNLHV